MWLPTVRRKRSGGTSVHSAFTQGLAELGWTDDRNLRMDIRWASDSVDRTRKCAKELVDLQPDVSEQ
jgi:putative tryptophan/tyrosine transport system substrate-binding protein